MDYYSIKKLSNSGISLILDCPARYKNWLDELDEKDTKALAFGRMFHMAILEPEKFQETYIYTDLNLTTKEGKAFKASLSENQIPIKSDEYEQMLHMQEAVFNHPQAKHFFKSFEAEKEIYYNYNGLDLKAKLDLISVVKGKKYVVDVKTTTSVKLYDLQKTIEKYGYYRQAWKYQNALIQTGEQVDGFFFIFIEKKSPYLITCVQLDTEAIEQGKQECIQAMETLKECEANGIYPCYTKKIETISIFNYKRSA